MIFQEGRLLLASSEEIDVLKLLQDINESILEEFVFDKDDALELLPDPSRSITEELALDKNDVELLSNINKSISEEFVLDKDDDLELIFKLGQLSSVYDK
ncbi:20706_t:CDS:1, partial [Gigaspora margarita]